MGRQLVNDFDISQKHIIKTWVWECDRCPSKIISEEIPDDWEEDLLLLCEECK